MHVFIMGCTERQEISVNVLHMISLRFRYLHLNSCRIKEKQLKMWNINTDFRCKGVDSIIIAILFSLLLSSELCRISD